MDLLVATTNTGKFAEVRGFLAHLPVNVVSLNDLQQWPEVVEDGASFEANALKKARTLAEHSGYLTLADDSGLEVDALGGAPGIYSARFGGEPGNDRKNNQKLMNALKDVPQEQRSARFVCALALCEPRSRGARQWLTRQSCEGRIALEPRGEKGFGYDPLFFYPPWGKTFGEVDRQIKATVSHRGKALGELAQILPQWADTAVKP